MSRQPTFVNTRALNEASREYYKLRNVTLAIEDDGTITASIVDEDRKLHKVNVYSKDMRPLTMNDVLFMPEDLGLELAE